MKLRLQPKFLQSFLALAVIVTSAPLGHALPVLGLYNHEIAITIASEAERNRAVTEALSAVIVKVTGQTRWLDEPVLAAALEDAQSYVEGFSYRSETSQVMPDQNQDDLSVSAVDPDPDSPASDLIDEPADLADSSTEPAVQTVEQLFINVQFSTSAINELLARAGAPVWDSNRPSVLVWLVLQNDLGQRSLLGDDLSSVGVRDVVSGIAQSRGLPVIFPLLDFEDRRNLSTDQLWELDENSIRLASSRYAADSILAGRLYTTASGELVGRWQFIIQDNSESFDGFDIDLEQYLYQPLDRVTNQLASRFAVLRTDTNQQNIRVRIEGVGDLATYSTVLNYLQSLGVVESLAVARLEGQSLELELSLLGDQQQLLEMISLDRDMTPIRNVVAENPGSLHYRWIR